MNSNRLKLITVLTGMTLVVSWTADSGVKEKGQDTRPKQGQLNSRLLSHEHLGRGVVAIPLEPGQKAYNGEGIFDAGKRNIYIGWRLLAGDPDDVAFNVYRRDENGAVTKLNDSPVTNSTNFVDALLPAGEKFVYTVVPVANGKEGEGSGSCTAVFNSHPKSFKSIKLDGDYTIERIAVADLDGDGETDFVTKYPGGNVDPWYLYWKPSPGTYKLQACKSNGEKLWTYDMGWAIEQGTWYSPYLVYDLNGDGKAEVIVKSGEDDPRNETGKVLAGPEYVTVLNGITGNTIARADWIPREPFFEVNKEHAYNYASRNQLAVAYLDGSHPHVIVLRGTYNLMMARAYRLVGSDLKLVWEWDNRNLREASNNYWGQGGHTTIAADVDGDGCDELILGSCVLDNDGKELWTTGLGHNDGAFIGDILPERPGLEIYYNIESGKPDGNGMCMADARTGEIIWGAEYPTNHVHGTGFCSDIDRTQPGRECYGVEISPFEGKRTNFSVMYNSRGDIVDRDEITTWSAFWDTDNQRELLGRRKIYEYKGPAVFNTEPEGRIIAVADLLGDWREEIITSVPGEVRIYSSTILADTRHNCLLQDPIYRNYVAHASTGYYELPMTTYDIPFRSSR